METLVRARLLAATLLSAACLSCGCTVCGALGDEYCEELGYQDWKAFGGWWRGPIDLAEDHACISGLGDLFLVDEQPGTLGFRVESGEYPELRYRFQSGCEFDGEVVDAWARVVNPEDDACVGQGVTLTIRACVGCDQALQDHWMAGSIVVDGPGGCAGYYEFDAEPLETEIW